MLLTRLLFSDLFFLCFFSVQTAHSTLLTRIVQGCSAFVTWADAFNEQNRLDCLSLIYKKTDTQQRSNKKTIEEKKTSFADVAGKVPADVLEVVSYIKGNDDFAAVGAEIPRGILFVGPPGNGKTLFARAIAGEVNASFFHATGCEFIELYVGVGPQRIRELFNKAKSSLLVGPYEWSIIFIDEIDAIGGKRSDRNNSGADSERHSTLTALLTEMDGFEQNQHIIVMAATNIPEMLDDALLRRLQRVVEIGNPDVEDCQALLRHYIRPPKKSALSDEEYLEIAKTLCNYSCSRADIVSFVNEAAVFAARAKALAIDYTHFQEALKKLWNRKKSARKNYL